VVVVGCATTQSPNSTLFDAIKKGDIEAVRKHLDAGADVNTKDEDGYTLLTVAVAYGSKEIVELLIFNGVDVNAFDPQVREKSIEIYEVADLLRKHGGKTSAELKAEGK
jgi:ankyrin repeat protein